MIFIRPILSILVVFPVNYVQGLRPDGEHVCLVTENYDETIYKKEWQSVTEIVKTWCWEVTRGFKCNKPTTKWKQVDVPQTVKRSKIVPRCCRGYMEDSKLAKCVPLCSFKCIHGYCTAPQTCTCSPGFEGFTCNIPCSSGSWGVNCFEKCHCHNSEICDRITGECPIITTTTTEEITSTTETTLETTTTTTTQSKFEEIQTRTIDQTTPQENWTTEESVITTPENEVVNTTTQKKETITSTEETDEINTTTQKIEEEINTKIVTTTQKVDEQFNTEKTEEMTTTPETTQKVEVYFQTSTEPTETTTLTYTTTQSTFTDTTNLTVTEENLNKKEIEEKETTAESPVFTTDMSNTIETDLYLKENEFIKNRSAEDLTNSNTILNDQNKRMKIVHFVPSLTVLTGVCILLFIIAARYIIVRKKRKSQKTALENQEKLFPSRGVQLDSVFTVNNFGENPVYLPEELNNRTPVLQTFKPLNVDNSPKTNETSFR